MIACLCFGIGELVGLTVLAGGAIIHACNKHDTKAKPLSCREIGTPPVADTPPKPAK